MRVARTTPAILGVRQGVCVPKAQEGVGQP